MSVYPNEFKIEVFVRKTLSQFVWDLNVSPKSLCVELGAHCGDVEVMHTSWDKA